MKDIIEARNLIKTYNLGANSLNALDDISFNVKEGEFVVILGPSGAGKSTLLNILGGMENLTSGNLFVNNNDISKYNAKELSSYRRNKIGFVFQFYNLMPNLTALENVELAAELKKDSFSCKEMLEKVGLKDKFNSFPSQLSGGQQQRVAISRALAKNPEIILCDEPTGALDYLTGKNILSLLYSFSKNQKKTIIVVTHNQALKDMADHLIVLKNGKIVEDKINKNPQPIEEISW